MRALALLLAVTPLVACERESDVPLRTFALEHVDAPAVLDGIRSELEPDELRSTRISVRADDPRVLTVAGEAATLERVAEVIARLDRPQGSVLLRFQVIEANGFPTPDPAIAEVEAVLRELFRFQGYRLAAEALVQAQAPGWVRQQLRSVGDEPMQITANVQRVSGHADDGAVSLDIEFTARGEELLTTSLTVPSGKTAVVGSAQGSTRTTLILVVRPEIQ
jgi:hypothetical protein